MINAEELAMEEEVLNEKGVRIIILRGIMNGKEELKEQVLKKTQG